MFKTYETELAGRKLVFETGKMAGLANGSVLVRYGDTVVIVNVTASKEPKDGIDFFHYQWIMKKNYMLLVKSQVLSKKRRKTIR